MKRELNIKGPQETFLFKAVAFFSRLQMGYLFHKRKDTQLLVALFALASGTTALATITLAAYLTNLPLLFPPLAPSAFILFYTPLSNTASPRNVLMSHTMALAAGLISLRAMVFFCPQSYLLDPEVMNWHRIVVIGSSSTIIGLLMIMLRCVHAPAAATALIAALGYFRTPLQVLGLVAAVVFLLLEAIVFVKLLGGLPYPLWKPNHKLTKPYRQLADGIDARRGFWEEAAAKIYKLR